MTRDLARPGRPPAERAADEIAAFVRLFQARRAAEDADLPRGPANARDMDVLAQPVQRHLEQLGVASVDGRDGRRESLVALLAYGTSAEYAPHAETALAQLRAAEGRYRSGEVQPAVIPATPHRRRVRGRRRLLSSRRLQFAGVALLGLAMLGLGIASCGSWGVVE